MRKEILEQICGFMLLFMMFLIVKYGVPQVIAEETFQNGQVRMRDKPVVVIDAGHGGSDPGKVGVDGSFEKEINLQIALKLREYLEQSDVDVVMTREEDTGLHGEGAGSKKLADMKRRCEIIEESGADLVVSIHQNSYQEEHVSGGQVFYYADSKKGKQLAEILQERFTYVLGSDNRRLAKANDSYYLLLHAKCPTVIVECGFLSNHREAAMLQQEDYQDRMAWTVHMGIAAYLNGWEG